MAIKPSFDNGQIVPADWQIMSETNEGLRAIKESGTPELLAALDRLRDLGISLQDQQHTVSLPQGWGKLVHGLPGGWPWVVSGSASETDHLIAKAKSICKSGGGRAVLVHVRVVVEEVKPARLLRDPLATDSFPEFFMRHKVMLVVPKPVRAKTKNGRTFLDWVPRLIESPKRKVSGYRSRVVEVFRESTDPDDFAVDDAREVRMLGRAAFDLAVVLSNLLPKWEKAFRSGEQSRIERFVEKRKDMRAMGTNGAQVGWFGIAMCALVVIGVVDHGSILQLLHR